MKWMIFLILVTHMTTAQDLKQHQWSERVVLITADESHEEEAKQQFMSFKAHQKDVVDRQMIIYLCLKKQCRVYDGNEEIKINPSRVETQFLVQLVGLDGAIKRTSNQLEPAQLYFDLIDTMPMRRSELNKRMKKNGN